MNSEDEILIRRYLLGEVDDGDQTIVEQRLMLDKPYFQHYLMLEERLTDEYVRGSLSEREHERFERHFMLAPERQESVAFARVLRRGVSEAGPLNFPDLTKRRRETHWRGAPSGSRPIRGTTMVASLACAMLVLLAAAAFLIVETGRLRREIAQSQELLAASARNEEDLRLRLRENEAQDSALTERLHDLQARLALRSQESRQAQSGWEHGADIPVISLALQPSLDRGETRAQSIHVPGNSQQLVRLDLELDGEDYKKYKVDIRTAEGREVLAQEGLKHRSQRGQNLVAVTVTGRTLTQNDYLVTLSGQTPAGRYEKIATYQFRVIR